MSTEPSPVDTVPTPNPNAIMLKVQETLVVRPRRGRDGELTAAAVLLALAGIEPC